VARLHSRIYLHFLGLLIVVALGTSIALAVGARGAFLRETSERVARHVASLVGEGLDDPSVLQRRLDQLRADLDVDLTVRDLDGRVLATAGRELPALDGSEAAIVRAGGMIAHGRGRWSAAAAVTRPGTSRPLAILQASARREAGFPFVLRPVLAVSLVLVIVAVGTVPLARRISRPVERLTEATRRLGGGDLSYRVPAADTEGRHRRARPDELQQLTRAFNEMADRIERLVRGHGELLANVSHELRSPLARIRVALELLPRDAAGEARMRDIEAELGDLDRLIEDVLTAARLDATGLPSRVAPIEARAFLEDVAGRARRHPLAEGRSIVVAPGPQIALVADEALLRRALWNLVENAAKYGAPPITLAAERDGAEIRFSVTDAGQGIPAGERERVLAPFYRRARVGDRGFGLGLPLAKRIADVHGGRISIGPASTNGGREEGCRVSIALPAEA
jgi:signal transduction histidine kinase